MSTLSTTELITDVMDAFKVRFPILNNLSTDFSSDSARLGQTITARIAGLPTVQDYGADGYESNAADANGLTTDVNVTLNRHKHVPVKIDYIDQISTKRDLYNETIGNLAYSLGKEAFDHAMSLAAVANFSQATVSADAASDKDVLDAITASMNGVGAAPVGRYGIVNSAVFNALEADPRISSGDYYGQRRGANSYGNLSNVSGFENIYEYPSLVSGAGNLSGFFATREAIVMASRLPTDVEKLANRVGIPSISKVDTVTDADTGLSLMGITWQKSGVFDVYTTLVWVYGMSAGTQGGAAGTLSDYAGHRLASA
tara:strand:+ start:685 stop:1626 length:942 start_codon:yes stop_codon:yes gene_type:complete